MKTKVGLFELIIETTRWCNMECPHCLRGERQRCKMKKEYIDKIFEDVDYVDVLTFTGGEPSLALDIIQYVYEKCVMENITICNVWATTNGKQNVRKFVDIMTRFINYTKTIDGEISGFSISTDQYHDKISMDNIEYVRDSEYYERSKDLSTWTGIMKYTIPEGRAADNSLATNDYRHTLSQDITAYFEDGNIHVEEGQVYLNAKGDIVFNCDFSYETQKEKKIFNIMKKGLVQGLVEAGVVKDEEEGNVVGMEDIA